METKKIASPKRPRKKVSVALGDVLLVPQSNGKYSIAYVLGFWPELESVMTVALLHDDIPETIRSEQEIGQLVSDAIAKRELLAVISTPVVPGKNGEWPKIGTVMGIDVDELLPLVPYKTGSVVGGKYVASPMVEGLVEAYRGLADWNALLPGRPGYLQSLVFRSSISEQNGVRLI